jgi:hypothetical protein
VSAAHDATVARQRLTYPMFINSGQDVSSNRDKNNSQRCDGNMRSLAHGAAISLPRNREKACALRLLPW